MRSKLYRETKEKVSAEPLQLEDAVVFLQKNARKKFDETVEVHIKLGIDPQKSEQTVRGNVVLPHGSPKKKRIAVFVSDAKQQQAVKEAGASVVGADDLIAEIESAKKLDADITLASPDMMPKIAKVAKILGPKGLMPNPKTGTVTPDVVKAVEELTAGKVSFKMDQLGNIHEVVGKVSWEKEKIVENIKALIDAVRAARPASATGVFLSNVTLKSTMSPGIRISL